METITKRLVDLRYAEGGYEHLSQEQKIPLRTRIAATAFALWHYKPFRYAVLGTSLAIGTLLTVNEIVEALRPSMPEPMVYTQALQDVVQLGQEQGFTIEQQTETIEKLLDQAYGK